MKTLSEYEPILAAAQHEEFHQAIEKSKDENGDISEKIFMEAASKSVDMLFFRVHGILDEY